MTNANAPVADAAANSTEEWTPIYSRWRHGGWIVHNVQYPGGACGCVSNNYVDKKWRIVCDSRRKGLNEPGDFTFPSRDAAARAERELVTLLHAQQTANAAS